MKNYFFGSDYHFNHKNIIKYENRPFSSVEEMNNEIVKRHNARVHQDDTVFFLGDLGFYASKNAEQRGEGMPVNAHTLLKQMNGKFYEVCGNHDTHSNKSYTPVHAIELKIGGLNIQLIHNPDHANLDNYDMIICGHCHGKFQTKEIENKKGIPVLIINVSVETNNYYPYTFNEIKCIWDKWLKIHPKQKNILTNIRKKLHNG